MDLPPISRLGFLTGEGDPLANPAEWDPAMVEVLAPAVQWDEVKLYRQGEALPVYLKHLGGRKRILADWPRSGPGRYRLRLEYPGWSEEPTVTVRPTKIGPAAYSRLLEDLETRLPVAVAIGLQRGGALSGIGFRQAAKATLAEELNRLRRAIVGTGDRPGLAEVLVELSRGPHKVLETSELWVPWERARRPHPSRLPQALLVGGNLAAHGRPERVLDTRVEHTVDVYENRLVNAYFHQVHLRLRRLIRVIEANPRSKAPTQERLLLVKLLRARRQAAFLDGVRSPTNIPTRLTMVLLRRPPYRAALEGYLEFRRSAAVRLEDPNLDAPLENLPKLYQTWGTLATISALLDVAEKLGYKVRQHRLVGRDAGGFYVRVLPDGKPAVQLTHPEHGTTVKLVPERTYGRGGALRSVSYPQKPDVALEVRPVHGLPSVYLFDPKYKLEGELIEGESADGKPKKTDIDKMHAYRDAVRAEDGTRVVRYAAILYPGPEVRYDEGLEALRAYPGPEHDVQKRVTEVLRRALGLASEAEAKVPDPN